MMITKYTAPTNLDKAERGAIWCHIIQDAPGSLWTQVSTNIDLPYWVRVGTILESIFEASDDASKILMFVYDLKISTKE